MSKETYDLSDLDAILAEFRGEDTAVGTPAPKPAKSPERQSAPAERIEVYSARSESAEEPAAERPPVEATVRFEPARPDARQPHSRTRPQDLVIPPVEEERADEEAEKPKRGLKLPKRKKAEKPPKGPKEKKAVTPAKESKSAKPPREYHKRRIPGFLRAFLCLIFFALSLTVLGAAVLYLHPASGTVSSSSADARLRLSDKLDVYVNNAASDALGDLAYIKKFYTIEESATVAPMPNPNCFGSTYDPQEVLDVINRAALLLDGQQVTFYAGADFATDEPIVWYYDDTILVIAWKEYIEGRYCNFAEVKIAHPSQFRRKLVDDTYGSSVQLYASELAKSANAVLAANADFYAFRPIGVTVYQRELYRFNPDKLDLCFIDTSGDLIFSRAGELISAEETQRFVEENDILFSLAFGPILVDDGELQYCYSYPIGEPNDEFTRSCIAMTDDLHYLLMTISWSPDGLSPHAKVNDLARTIYSKNVRKAYALDGGQTAEIIMMGEPFSRIDWNNERSVSDIIYFATAIPEEVRP